MRGEGREKQVTLLKTFLIYIFFNLKNEKKVIFLTPPQRGGGKFQKMKRLRRTPQSKVMAFFGLIGLEHFHITQKMGLGGQGSQGPLWGAIKKKKM